MIRTDANNSGPWPRDPTIASLRLFDKEIERSFFEFHLHSKACSGYCRNPVQTYEQGCDLCPEGCGLSVNITKLLYTRARHSPHGRFKAQYRHDWGAVDGLVRIIAHFNQGFYSNEICYPPATAAAHTAPEPVNRDRGTRPTISDVTADPYAQSGGKRVVFRNIC